MAETTAAAPCVKVDISHVLASGQDEDFADLADISLTFKDREETLVFPCHSSVLASASKVLCQIITSTKKDGWEEGASAMFAGHEVNSVRLVLAMIYGKPDVAAMMPEVGISSLTRVQIADLCNLVDKLDARWIAQVRHYARRLASETLGSKFLNTLYNRLQACDDFVDKPMTESEKRRFTAMQQSGEAHAPRVIDRQLSGNSFTRDTYTKVKKGNLDFNEPHKYLVGRSEIPSEPPQNWPSQFFRDVGVVSAKGDVIRLVTSSESSSRASQRRSCSAFLSGKRERRARSGQELACQSTTLGRLSQPWQKSSPASWRTCKRQKSITG